MSSGSLEIGTESGRAGFLRLEPDPVLTFLHLPRTEDRKWTAVLICPPFGWEEMCSYRARRRWAQRLAGAGYPAARFDLPGTGDSAGSPREPDRLDAWTEAVTGTSAWLREQTDSNRLAVIGIGLGGLVACRALSQGAPIDDLILWAVPGRGQKLLRELQAHAAIVAGRTPADAAATPPAAGELELTGFHVSSQTGAELEQLILTALPLPARRVLLLGRDGLGVDNKLRAHFERAGAEVEVADTSDYGLLMAHPQAASTPSDTIELSTAWLGRAHKTPGGRTLDNGGSSVGASRAPAAARDSIELRWDGRAIRERPLCLDLGDEQSFGILTEPLAGERSELCAVMLNAGALRHTGPNRAWVEIARRWATRGLPVIRLDLPGIGDGGGEERTLVSDRALYSPESTARVSSAIDRLVGLGLPDRFVVTGLCAGAYGALHCAVADARVRGAFMINLYAWRWDPALVTERATSRALSSLGGRGWRRLARRDVTTAELLERLQSLGPSRLRGRSGFPVERSQQVPLELGLDRLRDQGTEALLLLSKGEALYDQLLRQGQLDRLSRWPNVTVELIPSRDHMFRATRLQHHVHDRLDRALERVLKRQASSAL